MPEKQSDVTFIFALEIQSKTIQLLNNLLGAFMLVCFVQVHMRKRQNLLLGLVCNESNELTNLSS